MTGEIGEIFFFMWVVAIAAFAPLGYFIYMYTKKNGRPFGETEPHGDNNSVIANFADTVINYVKSLIGKK